MTLAGPSADRPSLTRDSRPAQRASQTAQPTSSSACGDVGHRFVLAQHESVLLGRIRPWRTAEWAGRGGVAVGEARAAEVGRPMAYLPTSTPRGGRSINSTRSPSILTQTSVSPGHASPRVSDLTASTVRPG